MTAASSAWRSRLSLFAILGAVILLDAGVLVGYRLFYRQRFEGLRREEQALRSRRDEARAALLRVKATEERTAVLQRAVEEFFGKTIGTRRERLAVVLEEVYGLTRRTGMRPASVSYAESTETGAEAFRLSFSVEGRYVEVKRLLASFETSSQFFVVENVGVTLDAAQPDLLKVSLALARYFSDGSARVSRRARDRGPDGGAR